VSKRTDILQQIKKYLNGELDAHAMHQFEKEAQNDSFLMDALEGYEQLSTEQQKNLDELHSRLQHHANKANRRIVMWQIISVAAFILIAVTIGGIWIYYHQPAVNKISLADKTKPIIIKVKAQADTDTISQPNSSNDQIALNNADKFVKHSPVSAKIRKHSSSTATIIPVQTAVAAVKKDTEPLNEMVVMGYTTQRKTDMEASANVAIPDSLKKNIKGLVRDENGPLPGVTISIKGSAASTLTDSHGSFSIKAVPNKSVLDITCVGYNRKQVKIKKQDSLLISMQPISNALAEVMITGYGTQKKPVVTGSVATVNQDTNRSSKSETGAEQPSLKEYLKNNAISPDGKTGVVKLSFTVNNDNILSNFKVIESLSPKTDSAAIILIRNYPGWAKDTTNKPENIKLKVKFEPKK